jgi:hypothetical protein
MMDLPTRSVVIAGTDYWDERQQAFKVIEEPRLIALLEAQLVASGRWEPGKPIRLQTPPIAQERLGNRDPAGVTVRIFPTWFTCEGFDAATATGRRRRLVPWSDLDTTAGRTKFQREDGKKVEVTPIRFVGACKKGHMQDLDWRWLVHRGDKCREPMWIEEEGSSADPANIRIGCLCGRPALSLADAFKPGFLGPCHGRRPWLDVDDEHCDEFLHFLSRSATNTYFPQTVTVISLPTREDALGEAIRKHWTSLHGATDAAFVGILRNVPEIGAALHGYADDEVFRRIVQMRQADVAAASQNPKVEEFDLLASGADSVGRDAPDEPLFAETLRLDLSGCRTVDDLPLLDSVVAVHRLRSVTCLYGFTRLEPALSMSEALLEDITLAVDGAPLGLNSNWLPAMEQRGEGIFLKVNAAAIRAWLLREAVRRRDAALRGGLGAYCHKHQVDWPYPGLPYILLHGLAHALMQEIALVCGYPLSALKERVYAFPGIGAEPKDRFGLLVYTASSGAQGTLGGLTAIADQAPTLLLAAAERLRLCANDPICADHDPLAEGDERSLHGAACHGCLLVPETSCEARNMLLDRSLIVETVSGVGGEIMSL